MKKLSICLLVLLLVLCAQAALAAEDMSAELARVTQSVKTTLAIGDEYTEFYGNQSSDRLFTTWQLYWSNDEEQINVTADSKGRIINYNRYVNQGYRYNYYGELAPIFPKQGRDEAMRVAREFLAKVLDKNEEMIFDSEKMTPEPVRAEQNYYFYGNLKINGLPSPLSVNIDVDMEQLRVRYFNREAMEYQYIGGVPAAAPKITVTQAAPTLSAVITMQPAYFMDDTGKTARLQYRPVRQKAAAESIEARAMYFSEARSAYYVDALSGELLDMDKLYLDAENAAADFYGSGRNGAVPAMAMSQDAKAMEAGGAPAPAPLTEVELSGTAEQSGLLSSKDIDAKLRALSELGLDSRFKLTRINYGRDGTKPVYYAYLSYYGEADAKSLGISEADFKKLKDSGSKFYTYKDFSLDAQTGEIRYLYTSQPYVEQAYITAQQSDHSAQATAFLTKYFSDYYKQTVPGGQETYGLSSSQTQTYYFTRQVNGYNFPDNNLRLRMNPYTGIIEDFNLAWDKEMTFAPVDKIISVEQAKQAYLDTMDCKLCYKQLPVAVDRSKPEFEIYISSGITYLYKMGLVYAYEPKGDNVYAVDAISGKPLSYSYNRQLFSYDDIAGNAAEAKIKELAQYGVGFAGGKFRPAAKLTELDMLLFFLSAQGNSYDPAELPEEKLTAIYESAYYAGILEQGYEMKPQREISRGEYLKTIVRMSGYGKTALIPGIYTCDFTDAKDIPADLYGYAAIAQGLGLVGRGGSLKPAGIIDRAEAAVIFHNFMSRKY